MIPPKSHGDEELIEHVRARFEPYLGSAQRVYHDEVNEWVHVDAHIVGPSQSPFVTLFTTGMSERFMTVPRAQSKIARTAELVMTLPPDWANDDPSLKDPRSFWPIAWLRFLARFPFKHKTFLGLWHTVPGMVDPTWTDPPTPFHAALLLEPQRLPEAARRFERRGSPESTVVLAVAPIFEGERVFAQENGVERLLQRFREKQIDPEIVDVSRSPVV